MNTRERHIIPPSGESASPFGLAPHGSGSAPHSPTFGWTILRSAKDNSVADAPLHKSVVCDMMLACARTKASYSLRSHKSVVCGRCHRCHAPFGDSAILSIGPRSTQTTSALHKSAFNEVCSLRSHKSVQNQNKLRTKALFMICQCACH